MTPAEYKAQLELLGLTPYTARAVLGISPRQTYRYASGEAEIPDTVAKLLRAMVALGTTEV